MNVNELLNIELIKFKDEIKNDYKNNTTSRNFIYLRLSKMDNRFPTKEERIKDALDKLRADFNSLIEKYHNLKEDGFKLDIEVKSAYKNSTREVFNELCENYLFKDFKITEILNPKIPDTSLNLYLSSFDRMSRVFLYSLPIQILRLFRNITINSLLHDEIKLEEEAVNILNKSNQDQLMFIFKVMLNSSHAEKHSEDLSGKVKKRVSKNSKGVTVSNKTGNVWGAPTTISDEMRKRIIRLYKRFTAKDISENSNVYQLVKGKKKLISIFTIQKIIQENKK